MRSTAQLATIGHLTAGRATNVDSRVDVRVECEAALQAGKLVLGLSVLLGGMPRSASTPGCCCGDRPRPAEHLPAQPSSSERREADGKTNCAEWHVAFSEPLPSRGCPSTLPGRRRVGCLWL